jgi:ribonucleoside-diphosphate reductase alpha chain
MKASQMGLKGVTIYREGSRSGVLVDSSKNKKEEFKQTTAPKRPKELTGHAYVTYIKGEKFNVVVGLLEDKPYEVFAFPSKNLKGEGLIIKQGKGEYDFIQLTDSSSNHRVLTDAMTDEQAALTRLLSTSLRHGAKIDFVTDQLNKTHGDLTSFSKAISRILSKFTEVKETGNCPECKTGKLIMQEGCKKCNSCEYSAC